ncbi:MAG TPA: TonB-dependent receptor [Ignavibacteriales bacterium]|nr:TonB-dependent receptor [Ignavibacteriales bacterium]
MKIRNLLTLLIFLSFAVTGSLYSQSTGKIMGKVQDKATGEAVPFANVVLEGTSLGAATDADGNFVVLNIPPGLYSVTASYIGYQKTTVKDVRVNVGFTTRLEIGLSSGEITLGAVVVQGERNPLIRQDLTNPTVAITSESIQVLPVDNITDVIKLQAGVVTGDDGSIHVRGGYGNEVAYSLNGLSMNDPYGNSRSVGIATNAVQEVSVSTGTFSAEFGNALSGVVNYITKEGSDKYSFSVRGYAGDYVTNRKDLFYNLDKIDPMNRGRAEATLGGPVPFLGGTNFFISGIFENFKGSYYGIRKYNTTDSYLSPDNFKSTDPRYGSATKAYFFNPYTTGSNGLPTGDGAIVPMNPSESWNIQGNISHRFGPLFKVKYELVLDKGQSKSFDRDYKYNPDGIGTSYSSGYIHSLDITHTVSKSTFYTLKGSYSYNQGEYYLYKDWQDPRYLPSLYSRALVGTGFLTGGTDNGLSFRHTKTMSLKGDLVSQMFGIHEVRAGFELRKHEVDRLGYSIDFKKLSNINGVLTRTSLNVSDLLYAQNLTLVRDTIQSASTYNKKPYQIAAYMQDKIELDKSLILNVGLRYEYFDPNTLYNPDISKNLSEAQAGYMTENLQPVKGKHMVSPRFSVSYPITDKGIIRFSYGHFYQIGSLSELYLNDKLYVPNVASVPTFGNPNVKPQKSVQYELGLQQQLTDDLKFDLTGYYKDVRDYIFTQTVYTTSARQYNILTNLAYSNVKGITLSFLKRRSPDSYFSATLDYTFQIAEGNRTYPTEDLFFSEASGKQSETFLVPLSFDRPHLINGTITFSDPESWSVGIIYNIQTGTPYTPALPPSLSPITYTQSSAQKPMNWNVDFKAEKFFKLGSISYSIFLQVENLFDTENERYVYASSGRALSNVEQTLNAIQFNEIRRRIASDAGMIPMSEIDNYYRRSENLSSPREVRLGFSLLFN